MWHPAGVRTSFDPVTSLDGADLHRRRRDSDLAEACASVSDVLVVGGGITGVGIALDAASRGLSVTLVEARDLAYGTSRWSSKLVHGGLRYLAHGDIGVAWESARERHHLMTTIAPHLIRRLPHVLPDRRDAPRSRAAMVRTGLAAADALRRASGTPRSVLPGSRRLSLDDVLALHPRLDATKISGGSGYWDGQLIDDARLVIAVARTAASLGARILTRMRASQISPDGVTVHDSLRGGTHDLRARQVIVATGIWAGSWDDELPTRMSRGTHVLIDPAALGHPRSALTISIPDDLSRYVFALPQAGGPTIVGLTDVPADDSSPDDTEPPLEEIEWVLSHLSAVLEAPIPPESILGAYSGYRPLIAPDSSASGDDSNATADISRRHLIHTRRDGVIIVAGGKLTTYRAMAEDALHAAGHHRRDCRTTTLPLIGAGQIGPFSSPRLVRRYGSEATRIAALDGAYSESAPADTSELFPTLVAEITHAIQHEGALTVDDIVQRRIRISSQPRLVEQWRPRIADIARAIDPDIVAFPVDA